MIKRNYAFIDGSFNPSTNVYGCGGFLIDQFGKKHIIQKSESNKVLAKMRNVAGEILGARIAISKAVELKMKKLTLFYDYDGIEKWVTGEWKTNKRATKEYAKFAKSAIMEGLKIFFVHVKGHSGIKGNEEADRLAKEAVGLISCQGNRSRYLAYDDVMDLIELFNKKEKI